MPHNDSALKRYNHLLGELEAVYHELSLRLGMSDSVSKILYTICNAGQSCPLHTICQQTGLSKQTVNSALRKIERQGLVYLESTNKKAKIVCLTEAGNQFADKTARQMIAWENEILDTWSQSDVQQYLSLTERFLEALKEKAKKAADGNAAAASKE